MEENKQQNEAANIVASLFVKSALIFWLFFLYIAVMWFWDHQNIITKISGSLAIFVCFVTLFMPIKDKHFKYMLLSIAGLSVLFYASQWLVYAFKT